VQAPEQLLGVLKAALALRASLVTERNAFSSRSHAVCSIELLQPASDRSLAAYLAHKQQGASWGSLMLVDLAGSERNYETLQMSAVQHKESADINLALMALKNCFRAHYFQHARIPYRASPLTKVLKDCFSSDQTHHTAIIATISPSPVDLQHSLSTAQHVLMMAPRLPAPCQLGTVEVPKAADAALSDVPVLQWTPQQVLAWIGTVERGRFAHLVLPAGIDGRGLLQLSVLHFTELFTQQEHAARQESEGSAWVVSAEETSRLRSIGLALFRAIRREELLHTRQHSCS
jgi:hypothetical protein